MKISGAKKTARKTTKPGKLPAGGLSVSQCHVKVLSYGVFFSMLIFYWDVHST